MRCTPERHPSHRPAPHSLHTHMHTNTHIKERQPRAPPHPCWGGTRCTLAAAPAFAAPAGRLAGRTGGGATRGNPTCRWATARCPAACRRPGGLVGVGVGVMLVGGWAGSRRPRWPASGGRTYRGRGYGAPAVWLRKARPRTEPGLCCQTAQLAAFAWSTCNASPTAIHTHTPPIR